MSGNYLLDTNIVIALFAGDPSITEKLTLEKKVFVPAVVLGELYFGALKSKRVENNISLIDSLAAERIILGCDKNTAKYYGRIKSNLKQKGKPIPENDIWIAAVAFQHNLTLVTRDTHFKEIDGLVLENW
ncbi:type II toxin-antitoxin system VapC family toxin [Neomoorella thermoacetica]|uniref:type II toxin-antitoxin system VapC family toxin n=1 Tax=Neomoorella thermoacetica TaxID=1525 RepID=UPI000472A1DA|nr:type II toxin-antitoxin system VapC family toxin [Moorella thermoacetica]